MFTKNVMGDLLYVLFSNRSFQGTVKPLHFTWSWRLHDFSTFNNVNIYCVTIIYF